MTNLNNQHTTMTLTKNTAELRALVEQHVDADQVIQGVYWDTENHRGCFIGCLNHSDNPASAEERFGLPIMVLRIAESIFEALPPDEAKLFFASLPNAVACDGKDLSRVGWQFLAAELRAMPAMPADVQAVIDPVISGMDLLASGQEWAAARQVAAAAADAADADVDAAFWSAAAAAAAARWSAAARRRQRDLLLRLIAEAPVVEVEA